MERVNNDTRTRNFEQWRSHPAFAHEAEATFEVTDPAAVEGYRTNTRPHKSVYMSNPARDEFSWRARSENGSEFTTAVKDSEGVVVDGVLDRIEVETEISEKAFRFYEGKPYFPPITYDRWKSSDASLALDFIPDMNPLLEYEKLGDRPAPDLLRELDPVLVDRTDDPGVRKEHIAYARHRGEVLNTPEITPEQFVKRIMSDMIATYTIGVDTVVVGVSGMPGSGKTSAVKQLEELLVERFGEAFRPVTLSTDDYHRGKNWLEATYGAPWTNWDAPEVYHTAALAEDIAELKKGNPIQRRHFDFESEEIVFDEIVHPSHFIVVEGLYAGSKDLSAHRHLHYDMPTSPADCVGRDIQRLILKDRANRAFPTPEDRLRYLAEVAVPTYLSQERPTRNTFSFHSRPLAERAMLLDMLKD